MKAAQISALALGSMALVSAAAFAETKPAKTAAAEWVCSNSCKTDAHSCAGHEVVKDATTKEACGKAGGKWMAKADFDKHKAAK